MDLMIMEECRMQRTKRKCMRAKTCREKAACREELVNRERTITE